MSNLEIFTLEKFVKKVLIDNKVKGRDNVDYFCIFRSSDFRLSENENIFARANVYLKFFEKYKGYFTNDKFLNYII